MGGKSSKASNASKVIDGKAIAADIRGEIKTGVAAMKAATGKVPGLAVVIVGSRPDSATYVRMKRKACDEAGIVSFHKEMPDTATEAEVLKVVSEFNANPDCHGGEMGGEKKRERLRFVAPPSYRRSPPPTPSAVKN
jgi:hypothetical protein